MRGYSVGRRSKAAAIRRERNRTQRLADDATAKLIADHRRYYDEWLEAKLAELRRERENPDE